MEPSTQSWVDVGIYWLGVTALVMGVIGGIYSLVNWIKRTIFAPTVDLFFDRDRTYHNRRDAHTGCDHVWVHATAKNSSRGIIRNCKVYAVAVRQLDDNGTSKSLPDFNSKLPLCWAHSGGLFKMDLLGGETTNVDLLMVDSQQHLLRICTDPSPAGTQKWLGKGRYVIKLQCYSDNANPGAVDLQIDYDGKSSPVVSARD